MRLIVIGLMLIVSAGRGAAQSTAFAFQGRLEDGSGPANGLHDLRFRLFDAAAGGGQIGTTLCLDDVGVADGLFAVQLDFGQQFASSTQRFLEIEVRRDTGLSCGSASGFTPLAPRKLITATPRAIHAQSAFALAAADGSLTGAVQVDNAGNVGIGTATPAAKLHINTGDLLAGTHGQEWIFHTRSHAGGDFLQITDTDAGVPQWQRGLVLTQTGRAGIGTTVPQAALDVRGAIRLGPAGEFTAVQSEGTTRLAWGVFEGSHRVVCGVSIQRIGTGRYRVTYNRPFTAIPAVTVTAREFGSAPVVGQVLGPFDEASTTIGLRTTDDGEFVDADFSFTVMGF